MFRKIEPMKERNEAHQENPKVLGRAIEKKEFTLAIYVFDTRPPTMSRKDIIDACHDRLSHLPLCIIFNESQETYYINKSNSSPIIHSLGLPMSFSSLEELQQYLKDLAEALHRKEHAIIKQVRLACPGNLGAAESTLISNDVDRLVRELKPNELLFFIFEKEHLSQDKIDRLCFDNPPDGILEATDDAVHVFNLPLSAESCASGEVLPKTSPTSFDGAYDKQPDETIINLHFNSSLPVIVSETSKLVKPALPKAHSAIGLQPSLVQEIITYYKRTFTQMNYLIPNSVTFGAWIDVRDIFPQNSNAIKLIKLPPPLSLHKERTLAVYILSAAQALAWPDLPTIGSTRHYETYLYVACGKKSVYNPEKGMNEEKATYKILEFHISHPAPKVRKKAISSTLSPIALPSEPLTEDKFIDCLMDFKNPKFVSYNKLRLCLEANFDDGAKVAPIVNHLVKRLLPDYLAIIHTAKSEQDAQNYLKRLKTADGFSLPPKKMKGNCIPEEIILRALRPTKTSSTSPLKKHDVSSFNSNHSTLNCEPTAVEEENVHSTYFGIDWWLYRNIIPKLEENQRKLPQPSITEISPSNIAFSFFRPGPPDQDKTARVTLCTSGEVAPKTSPASLSFDSVYDKQPDKKIINLHSNSSSPKKVTFAEEPTIIIYENTIYEEIPIYEEITIYEEPKKSQCCTIS